MKTIGTTKVVRAWCPDEEEEEDGRDYARDESVAAEEHALYHFVMPDEQRTRKVMVRRADESVDVYVVEQTVHVEVHAKRLMEGLEEEDD